MAADSVTGSAAAVLTLEARADIQGVVTSAYGHLPDAAFMFLEFTAADRVPGWLAALRDEITTSASWRPAPEKTKEKPESALNIAFTFDGTRALGLPDRALYSFSREFQFGMPARAEMLGDVGANAPDRWDFGFPSDQLHAVLMLYGRDQATLDQLADQQTQWADAAGVRIVADERGHRFTPAHEQFGFEDGISQPEIEGVKRRPDPGQTLIRTGEVIIGYPNEYGILPPSIGVPEADDPRGALPPFPGQSEWRDFGRHGTYLVFRKLEQDIAGFWNSIQRTIEQSDASGGSDEAAMLRLGAKFVGRWRSGASLTLSPDRDDPALGVDDVRNNDFAFIPSDSRGFRCPLGAHIRRANPRDSLAKDTAAISLKTVRRHRILRRGIPYGDELLGDSVVNVEDDGRRRGLHFIALGGQIKRQFEFVQQQWVNDAQFGGLFDNKDPLISNNDGTGQMTLQGQPLRTNVKRVPRFVTTRGGGYFFVPSLTAIDFLSAQ